MMDIEDRLDILQKIAEYSYTFDGKDADGWANLFTEDGIWDSIIKGQETPTEHLVGRDAIREWAVNRHKTIPDTYRSFHHQSGTIFDALAADSANTRTMVIITGHDMSGAGDAQGAQVSLTGIYHDDWVKTSDGWRMKKRVLVM
jgi:hypothetical protein